MNIRIKELRIIRSSFILILLTKAAVLCKLKIITDYCLQNEKNSYGSGQV